MLSFMLVLYIFPLLQDQGQGPRIINFIYLFIYLWLRWVFVAAHGLTLVAASRGYSSFWCAGFSLWWLLLLRSTGSRRAGFSSGGSRAQQLWRTGLFALRHVGSSQTRDGTRVPCTGRRILNHWATREVPQIRITVRVNISWPQEEGGTP